MTENSIDTFINIENAAHDGAFGINNRPIPTDAQCVAGNYKVGRISLYGMPIAIEQPRHSYRTGVDSRTGKRWATRLAAHYGYFSGTKGADGDPVDCFVGFYPQSEYAWVINQHVDGSFDEHKIVIAVPDEETARKAYLDSYEKGWNGLHSIVKTSIAQLKWWLKNGNHKNPLKPEHLPYEGFENMSQKVTWDSTHNPEGMTIDKVLYEIRRADAGENLVLDAVAMADILAEADEIMALDALTSPYAKLQRKMEVLQAVMARAGGAVKPVAMQLSEPFKQNGVAQVAAVFELSDGQTVSIFFHNPDVNPKKITPADELISWKWLLNKKDITIVVAPEKGMDLNVKAVAERIIKLAEKNSSAFQRANVKRAENLAAIESLKAEIPVLEKELADAQHELEVAKIEAEDKAKNTPAIDWSKARELDTDAKIQALGIARIDEIGSENVYIEKDGEPYYMKPPGTSKYSVGEHDFSNEVVFGDDTGKIGDPTSPEGYAKIKGIANMELRYQDVLDSFFQSRIAAVWAALKELGWNQTRGKSYDSMKNGYLAKFNFKNVGAGANVVGYWVEVKDGADIQAEIGDNLTGTPTDVAAQIDAVATSSGTVTKDNYPPVPEVPQGDTSSEPDLTEDESYDRDDILAVNDDALMNFIMEHKFETAAQSFQDFLDIFKDSTRSAYDLDRYLAKDFAETAFLVEKEVESYGGKVVFGNFDHTAYNAGIFDRASPSEATVMPGSIVGEIADKTGDIVARFRVEENGMMTMYKGASGLDRVADPTMAVSRINAAVAAVFGGEGNKLQEPNLGKDAGIGSAEKPESQDQGNPGGLTDAEMVVLIAASGYKAFARFQNAYNETKTSRFGGVEDGISEEQYNAARDSLNAVGKYLKRSAITPEGDELVKGFHPELRMADAKLNLFAGKFAKSDSASAADPNQPHIDTLQSIVDGQHDGEDLDALLDKIDAAASALEAAGLAEQYDDLIGKAATKWAELDQKANG